MASNKFFSTAVAVAATLSVAVLAGCPSTPTTPTPSGSASVKPSGTPSGTPASPSSPSSPSGSASTASPAPTAIPSTPDTSSRATIQGIVFDDTDQRLSDVTVTGKILGAGTFANGSDTLSVSTQVGSYALNGAPTGQTILITATKNGFTTRQQTIVPLANLQGNTDQNRVDFGVRTGSNANETFSLSDKPEVQTMTPKPDSTGIDPATTFTLTFSEPVNKSDVEDRFAIAVSNDRYTLTNGAQLPKFAADIYVPGTDMFGTGAGVDLNNDGNIAGPGEIAADNPASSQIGGRKSIYTTAAFTFAWSNNDQTVTATFRPGYKLPTDKDSSKIPQYAVGFQGNIRDAAGSGTRTDKFFRVSPAQIGKNGFRFTVAADTTAPRLLGITALNNATSNANNDAVRFQFSETMVLYPSNASVTSIPNAAAKTITDAGNFQWFKQVAKPAAFVAGNFPSGAALYDGDPTQSTTVAKTNANNNFDVGDDVWGAVATTVEDPAGNQIETSNGSNIKSAKGI